jgi:hypothetical protein
MAETAGPSTYRPFASTRTLETAEGVLIGFLAGGLITYLLQHFVKFQRTVIRGTIAIVCPPALLPQTVRGGQVIAVGTAGPGAGGVYDADVDANGHYQMVVPPGIYAMGFVDQNGQQTPPLVVTPGVTQGRIALFSPSTPEAPEAPELIYDVWAQIIVPASRTLRVDLVVTC